jgi:type II secretory pathway pseudopilin PulG
MFKLKSKYGFTIIEVLCAMGIFILLSLFIVTLNLNIQKIKDTKANIYRYNSFLEAFKNKIIANTSFEELTTLKGSALFINGDNLFIEKLKNRSIKDLVQLDEPLKGPYIKLDITGSDVIKTDIVLYYSEFKQNLIKKMYFYKGNY